MDRDIKRKKRWDDNNNHLKNDEPTYRYSYNSYEKKTSEKSHNEINKHRDKRKYKNSPDFYHIHNEKKESISKMSSHRYSKHNDEHTEEYSKKNHEKKKSYYSDNYKNNFSNSYEKTADYKRPKYVDHKDESHKHEKGRQHNPDDKRDKKHIKDEIENNSKNNEQHQSGENKSKENDENDSYYSGSENKSTENSSSNDDTCDEYDSKDEHSSDNEKDQIDCILNGCRSIKNYKKLNKISEGTYGTVFRAKNKKTKKIIALKQLKNFSNMRHEGFAITSLREINILLQLEHENILSIKEVIVGKHLSDIYLVMEYIEHELKMLLDNKSPGFTISELKCLLKQLLSGINYLHTNWVMHRDLKPTNLLYSNKGILKICDFGMARKFGHVDNPNLTKNVVTLWYRAPELLLGERCYTNKIDMWSVGCIFAEMILKKPLFLGENEVDQMWKILNLLGLPDKEAYPKFYEYPFISKNKDLFKKKKIKMNVNNLRSHFPNIASQFSGLYLSDIGLDLLKKLLHFNPQERMSASDALKHPYFNEFPKPLEISDMPVIPDSNKVIRSNKLSNHFNFIDQNSIMFRS
ncbi:cdc2-related protein kinase 1, putative [Plasmodium vinckei]|uniref:Cyclin-dependent kinase 2 homolog n=1 Tax=Plasmodium vinckei TaxID=5860 RepID=A0A6V7SSZ5_PLAVN|nr:cdc2-related protein kinase 1, putative [Plasmodium vinckei]